MYHHISHMHYIFLIPGIYVIMLLEVLKSWLKSVIMFAILVIGFALSFYCLLDKQKPFNSPGWCFLRLFCSVLRPILPQYVINQHSALQLNVSLALCSPTLFSFSALRPRQVCPSPKHFYSYPYLLLGLSIAKVLVWFIGEISYEDLFLEQQLEYVEIATIILFIFFITMNIAFINLLVSFCYIKANIGANRLG